MTIRTQTFSGRLSSFFFILLLVALPMLTACGDDKDDDSAGTHTPDSASFQDTTAFQHNPPATTSDATAAAMVQVNLSESTIDMPATAAAGPTDFVVKNNGSAQHDLKIKENGMETNLPQPLMAGEIRTIRVDLKPGTYEVTSPASNGGKEMKTTLTVQ
jgi:hypothetical protein